MLTSLSRISTLTTLLAVVGTFGGCSLNEMAADSAAELTISAAPKLEGLWDVKLAMAGTPSGIMQLEAMRSVSPHNRGLLIELAKAYVGYAYAQVEVDYEIAESEGNMAQSDALRARARRLYERARDLGLAAVRLHDDGIDAAIKGGPDGVRAFLADRFSDPDDVAPLFWTAIAWGSIINMASDDPAAIADLGIARALAERVVQVNPGFQQASALAFMGGVECGFPEQLGGSIAKGKEYFERALNVTGRRAHTLQLNYARQCALNARDKDLYVQLLDEIIVAGDQGNDVRLANKIARARAERYLAEAPKLF